MNGVECVHEPQVVFDWAVIGSKEDTKTKIETCDKCGKTRRWFHKKDGNVWYTDWL